MIETAEMDPELRELLQEFMKKTLDNVQESLQNQRSDMLNRARACHFILTRVAGILETEVIKLSGDEKAADEMITQERNTNIQQGRLQQILFHMSRPTGPKN